MPNSLLKKEHYWKGKKQLELWGIFFRKKKTKKQKGPFTGKKTQTTANRRSQHQEGKEERSKIKEKKML